MDEADAVIGKVRGLDDSGPRAVLQAGGDVFAVLLMPVPPGPELGVGYCCDQFRYPVPNLAAIAASASCRSPSGASSEAWS